MVLLECVKVRGKLVHFKSGFTLIELMITIVVIAIIATIAVPSFRQMIVQQNLKKSTHEFVAVLNQARSMSVLERRNIQIEFSKNKVNNPLLNTATNIFWAPQGSVTLTASSPTTLTYGLNGGLNNFTSDLVFTLCAEPKGNSRIITVSKMGTVQQVVEGKCT